MDTNNNDDLSKKILEEQRREDSRRLEWEKRKSAREAYSVLFLLFSFIFIFGSLLFKQDIPIAAVIIVAIGDILSFRGLGIF